MNWEKAMPQWVRNSEIMPYSLLGHGGNCLLDCSLGSNPLGPPPEVVERFGDILTLDLSSYHFAHKNLARSICSYWNGEVEEEEVLFGAGSSGVIISLARALVGPESVVLGLAPQYTDVPMHFGLSGGNLRYYDLKGPDYAIDADELISMISEDVSLVYLDRPHNPTGQVLSLKKIFRIAEVCSSVGALLIVDEAYGGFIPDDTSAVHLDMQNLICLRSFSKGWGLASLRAGYGVIRHPRIQSYLTQVASPFPISIGALEVLPEVIRHRDRLRKQMEAIVAIKRQVKRLVDFTPGLSMARSRRTVPIMLILHEDPEVDLYASLFEAGIRTESGRGFMNLGANAVRLRIPAPKDMEIFTDCWKRMKFVRTAESVRS